jgi:drug/metabolite transporter (DMT)-like permease
MRFAIILFFYALISGYGLYRLKDSTEILSAEFLLGAFCYGFGFIIWLGILRIYPLSLAFPAAAGALILTTQVFGIIFLDEHFSWQTISGTVLIALGIALIYLRMGET